MKLIQALCLAATWTCALPCSASFVLQFDELNSGVRLGNTYQASHGVVFGASAVTVQEGIDGIALLPSAPTAVTLNSVYPEGASSDRESLLLNVGAGFGSFFRFQFATLTQAPVATVSIFSGADGAGTLLGYSELGPVFQGDCATDLLACRWELFSAAFSGRAQSVLLSADRQSLYLDNLGFGDFKAAKLPEPSHLGLLGLGLVLTLLLRRPQRASLACCKRHMRA